MRVGEEACSQVRSIPTKAAATRRLGPDCTKSAEEPGTPASFISESVAGFIRNPHPGEKGGCVPDLVPCPRVTRPRTLALGAVAAIALSTMVFATSGHSSSRAELVAVDHVPPDACVAVYGPGPCREHGTTIIGSTDAVALWPAPAPAGARPMSGLAPCPARVSSWGIVRAPPRRAPSHRQRFRRTSNVQPAREP